MLVFISYHTPDQEKADAVVAALKLRRPGLECYLAPRNIAGGAWWVPGIAEAVARADAMLFLAGRRIGPWQELEYYEALRLSRKGTGRPRLIPVVFADQAPGLPFFAQLHRISTADPAARDTLDAIERAFDDAPPADATPAWQRFQPYKGLPALEEADAAFFFGRDQETADVLDRMARHPDRIVTLIGQSGVGKSSLARAGVLARLKSQLSPLETGEWPAGLRDSRAFLPLVVRPGEQPLKELALAFAQLYARSFELDKEASGWAARFAEGAGLHDMLRATRDELAAALGAEPPKRFVVYLDQGEELYTRAKPEEARRFSALVAEAAGHEAFSVLMSLRSDYYPDWQSDRALFDAAEHVDVLAPVGAVLGEIIRRPAASLGARFESSDMAERVAEATEREPGALPLLSDLLHEMWVNMQARGDGELRWADTPGLVDIAAPLRRRAEAFLADPANDEAVVRRLFTLRLAHVPEIGEPVRRRAYRGECNGAEWQAAEKLAGQDWRLLTLAQAADGTPIVEVAHEQLLRRWPRLKSWLDEQRDFLVWKGQVEHDAAAYAVLPETERGGALLMGRSLVIARGWFERRAADLAPETRDFIAGSLAADNARRDAERSRRRIALFATSAALVVALVLAGLAGWQWYEAEGQRILAEARANEVRDQRDRAERSLALATQTANGLIFEIAQKFKHVAGVPATTIKGLLDSASKLQEQLVAGGESSPELRRSQAAALLESVEVLLTAGDTGGAMAAAERAREVLQALSNANPHSTDYQSLLSVGHSSVGDVLVAAGRNEEGLGAYQKSLAIAEKLVAGDPGNSRWQRDLEVVYERIGHGLVVGGRDEEALAAYQKSLTNAEKLATADPGNTTWQRDLSVGYDNIGDSLASAGRREEALAAYQKALVIREKFAAADPGNTQWLRDLSVSYWKIGDMLVAAGRREEALALCQTSLANAEKLAATDPGNTEWQRDLSISHEKLGDVQVATGRDEEVLGAYRKSLAIRQKLAVTDPQNMGWQRDLSFSYRKNGDVLVVAGRLEEALAAYQKSLTIREKLAADDPGNTLGQRDLAESHVNIGDVLATAGHREEALAAYQKSLAIGEKLAADPGNTGWEHQLAVGYGKIGDVLVTTGHSEQALSAYEKMIAITEKLAAADPANTEWQRNLSHAHTKIGSVLQERGQLDGALSAYRDGLAIITASVRKDSDNLEWQFQLSHSKNKIGDVLRAQGHPEEALAAYRDDLAILTALARRDPDNSMWQFNLSVAYDRIGDMMWPGHLDEALSAYRDGLTIRTVLAQRSPGNTDWQQGLAASEERTGLVLKKQGHFDAALTAYRRGLVIRAALAQTDPENTKYQLLLSQSYLTIGDLIEAQGELDEALVAFRDRLAIVKKLTQKDPGNAEWQRSLEFTLGRIANANLDARNARGALDAYAEQAGVLRRLYEAAHDARFKSDLAATLSGLSWVLVLNHRPQEALASALEALSLDPSNPEAETNRAHALLFLDRFEEAKVVYLENKDKPLSGNRTFAKAVMDDFQELRKYGINNPGMNEIEALLAP